MESSALIGLIGLGLLLNNSNNNNNNNNNSSKKNKKKKNNNNITGGKSIYNSNDINIIKNNINKKCQDNFKKSEIIEDNNIIPKNHKNNKMVYSDLLGEKIKFVHSNQVPFFGGNLKQNTNPDIYATKLDLYTGNEYEHKPERNSSVELFKPVKNLTNINGSSIYNDKDRYEPAANTIKNNEKPIESIRVGPGLGLNYFDGPKGGYQQFDARKYELPKNVDQLRTENNQKKTYEGRIIKGKFHVSNRDYSDIEFTKDKKQTFAIDKEVFPSKSYYNKPKAKPTVVLKYTNRKESKDLIGTVGNSAISKEPLRPKIKRSSKVTFASDTTRNVNSISKYKDTINMKKSMRGGGEKKHNNTINSCNQNISLRNIYNSIKKRIMPFFDESKTTIKQTTEYNTKYNRNFDGSKKNISHFTDKAKNTIKQTTECNKHEGVVKGNNKLIDHYTDKAKNTIKQTTECNKYEGIVKGNNKLTIHYGDKAKKTIKENTICKNNMGQLKGTQTTTKHFQDNAKKTIKENTICENNMGQLKGTQTTTKHFQDNAKSTNRQTLTCMKTNTSIVGNSAPKHTKHYEDLPSTTIKETTSNKEQNVNMPTIQVKKRSEIMDEMRKTLKDTLIIESDKLNLSGNIEPKKYLDDNLKTTHKETYANNSYTGIADQENSNGYTISNFEAKETNKETTSNNEYVGVADQKDNTGYISANFTAKETNREDTSNNEYVGTISSKDKKTMSYDDIYNATFNEVKEVIAEGRLPTGQGDKNASGSDSITLQINKNEYEDNRTPNLTNIISNLPNKEMITISHEKENNLIDEIIKQQQERNDGSELKQLENNKLNISII